MTTGEETLYAAFVAKDPRFDGRFFVGIASTGIYCRPVCRARQPKRESCRFYASAAEAEQDGFRPCLLCRPELAPGLATVDAGAALARRAARLFEEASSSGAGVEALAGELGYTARHLRRAFTDEMGVSPQQYLQTCRLLLAKGLLTDTDLRVADVVFASGFGSVRRFNDVFKQRYRLSPTALRRSVPGSRPGGEVTVRLGYRPPYRWDDLLAFLRRRAIVGVEVVDDVSYARTVRLRSHGGEERLGWIRVEHAPRMDALEVGLSASLLPEVSRVLARVRGLFDLHADPAAIDDFLSGMDDVRPGLHRPGIRVSGAFDPFEMAVRAVLGQQVTVRTAGLLASRIAARHGAPLEHAPDGLTHAFPSAEEVAGMSDIRDAFGRLGVTSARSATIAALATGIVEGTIDLSHPADPEREMTRLMRIKGVGPWTAGYIGMRAMAWPDVFLETDAGVRKALAPRTPAESRDLAEAWRPWRSYATINLWNSLETRTTVEGQP